MTIEIVHESLDSYDRFDNDAPRLLPLEAKWILVVMGLFDSVLIIFIIQHAYRGSADQLGNNW